MNKLKILLQYDAGKFIHVAILVMCYILSKTSYLAIGCFVIEFIIIFKQSKRLIIYALVIIVLINIRFQMNQDNIPADRFTFKGIVTKVEDNRFFLRGEQNYLCYTDNTDFIEPGTEVTLQGEVQEYNGYQIMHTFDYNMYLKSQGIDAVIYVDSLDVVGYHFVIQQIPYRISLYIKRNFSTESSAFLHMFILGQSQESDVVDQNITREIGIAHLFAISGLHLGLIIGLLSAILNRFYLSKSTNRVVIVLFLLLYNIITGFKISIIRASLLVIGLYAKHLFSLLLTRVDLIALSFLGFLLYNPFLIYYLGFQLSYLIVLCLLLTDGLFHPNKKIIAMMQTTLLATLFSFPLITNVNQEFGLIFLYANVFFILYITYLFLPFTLIVVFFPILDSLYQYCIIWFQRALWFFDSINIVFSFSFPNQLFAYLYLLLLVLIITMYHNMKRRLLLILSMILLILSSIFFPFFGVSFVRFLDVGQGDSIHVHDGACDLLIDTGPEDKFDHVVHYLKGINRTDLDYLVISHWHADHYKELNDILQTIDVNHLYLNRPVDIEHPYEVVEKGDTFTCGSSKFQVLSADRNSENENDNSIVLFAEIGDETFLFGGDMEQAVEKEIMKTYQFKVDVLKVTHHGSNTSSTEEWLSMLQPDKAIIQVGKDNMYGLPDAEIVERLKQYTTDIYRTDFDGTITIYQALCNRIEIVETYSFFSRRHYRLSVM